MTAACLVILAIAARADPVTVTATPLSGFGNFGGDGSYGPLAWRGGFELSSSEEKFGGLSGLALSDDCTGLTAVSDAGRWFRAALAYDGKMLAGLGAAELAPILDDKGRPPKSKATGDAEALAAVGHGLYMVGFERRSRIGIYDLGKSGLQARFKLLKSPQAIAEGPHNGEIESVGHFAEGSGKDHDFAISEENLDANGDIRAWLWQGDDTAPFAVKRLEDYKITDAAILPGGDVLILERSFGPSLLPGMALRRFKSSAIKAGATVEPELLFSGRAPLYAIDNMEGIAVCQRDGELRLTIVSDNNFNTSLQRTLLLQFAYNP